jgi:hypothetical protein
MTTNSWHWFSWFASHQNHQVVTHSQRRRLISSNCSFSIMIASLSFFIQFKIVRYLLLHWRSNAIAAEVHCHVFVVYKIQINLFVYERFIRSQIHMKDASRSICKSVKNALIHYLEEQLWTQQSEMIWFLWENWDIYVHRFTVSRLLKRREWSNKSARRIDSHNEYLRQHWIADLLNLTAKQLVFVDELLFNEITDWRLWAYALIDQSARYRVNIIRDRLWSVLSAYTSNDRFFVSLSDLYLFVRMIEIEVLNVKMFSSYFYA